TCRVGRRQSFRMRGQHSHDRNRDDDDETCERAGDADVEEGAARRDGRLDLDERTERAGAYARRPRQKEGQRGRNTVAAASDVMTALVREQDGEQCGGERRTLSKKRGMRE